MATPEFEGWAIVELMGHRKLAGRIREVTIAGGAFIRLDVPSDSPVTQYYGPSAIYCITPTTEELATRIAAASRPTPVHQHELPAPKAEAKTCSDCGAREVDEHAPWCIENDPDYEPSPDDSSQSGGKKDR